MIQAHMPPEDPLQPWLPFPVAAPADGPLLELPETAAARRTLSRSDVWPLGQLALIGPEGAGKSVLAGEWARMNRATLTRGEVLAGAGIAELGRLSQGALVVDNADVGGDGSGLLTVMNLCAERGARLLLVGRDDPVSWFAAPRDLVSRLAGLAATRIDLPDVSSLRLLLARECRRRFIRMPEDLASFIATRMSRSYTSPGQLADRLHALASAAPVGRGVALQALRDLGMLGDDALEADDSGV